MTNGDASIEIRRDDPALPEITALLREHLALMREVSEPGTVHALDVEALRAPNVSFWSARRGEDVVGCGALAALDATHAEVKSMHVRRNVRRAGIASLVLARILDEARAQGFERVSLETGSTDAFTAARSFYAARGFAPCERFGDYPDHPHSAFMTLTLER